ncbi:MAG: hypothetical protein ACREGA_04320 [Candidatus Saccharimonadales bacterium]
MIIHRILGYLIVAVIVAIVLAWLAIAVVARRDKKRYQTAKTVGLPDIGTASTLNLGR